MRRLRLLAVPAVLAAMLAPITATAAPGSTTFPGRIDLPPGFAPEGITNGRGTDVFVGSLVNGAIWRGDVQTGEGAVLFPGSPGLVSVGVDFDDARDLIWVAGGPTGVVRAHDATDGSLEAAYHFPSAGFLNDLTVTGDAVYVTDSMVQKLAVVPLSAGGELPAPGAASWLPLGGDLVYESGFNLNGIVATRGGLVSVQSNTGRLFRIDPRTGDTALVDTGGWSLTNGDGLELLGSTLYVVRNQISQVDILHLGARLQSATPLGTITNAGLDVPTTAAVAAGRLWAVNARFGEPVTPTTDYWITRLPLRP